jgi:hypothetical protein
MVAGDKWPEIMQKHGITTSFISASKPEMKGIACCRRRAVAQCK